MSFAIGNYGESTGVDGTEVLVDGCDTVPKLFLQRSSAWSNRIAMREKDFGIWQTYTWTDYRDRAFELAHGLLALGLERGDVVSIQSEDCREWVFADMGTMLSGGVVNGIYPTYQANQVAYALTDSGCRFLFVEDEEQLDKYLAIEADLPNIEQVIVFDWKGLRGFQHDRVMPFERLLTIGQEHWRQHEGQIEELVATGNADDLAVLIYTSGTTGPPKGAMIPHKYLLFNLLLAFEVMPIGQEDDLLTYLPLCHVAERFFSLCMPLAKGAVINFAESPETVAQNFRELSPTVVFAVPRVWEKFCSRVTTDMSEATWIGRTAYAAALAIGGRRAEKLIRGRKPSLFDNLLFRIADALVFSNIKELLGLDRARYLLTGAAPISDSLLRWYLAMGLAVNEVYGQTETGLATITRVGIFRQGTVGDPIPHVQVRISEDDEILVRSPFTFLGYLNKPDKTASTIVDGWVHTGDVGRFNDTGQLIITDRMKDIIITAGGKNITPSLIENELKFSPFVTDSVVIGDQRKYLTCLIMIDKDNVEHYAQTHAVPFTDYRSLCARPEIVDLIAEEVRKVNARFSSVEQIKKFRLIDVLLTAEDEELTPTMKLKRSFISEKYNALIDDMYGPAVSAT